MRWIFDEQLDHYEASVLEYLNLINRRAPETTELILSLTWLGDDIDPWETTAAGRLYELVWWNEPGFAEELATALWITDGVTPLEVSFGITSLTNIAISPDYNAGNPKAASQIMNLIGYPPDALDLSLILVMSTLREHSAFNVQTGMQESIPERLNELVSKPWFVDGLDQEERVYLVAAIAAEGDQLYEPYTIGSKAIELPLAGTVNLWVVGHHRFDSGETLMTMEQAVVWAEAFWEAPFPMEHVILYVLEPGKRGVHIGYMMFLATSHGSVPQTSMFHEVAHFYVRQGPRWFTEGAAEVVAHSVDDYESLPTLDFRFIVQGRD